MTRVRWDRKTSPAAEYEGYYTVSLPVDVLGEGAGRPRVSDGSYMPYGGGYLVFTVNAAGKATYSGKLADGTRFSGSSVLVEMTDAVGALHGTITVFVPLYARGGYLAGRLGVVPLARREVEEASVSACAPYAFFEWSYPGQSPARNRTADAFTVTLIPCGATYAKGATLESHGVATVELVTGEAPDDAAYAYTVNRVKRYAYATLSAFPAHLDLVVADGKLTAPAATSPVRQADGSYVYGGGNDAGLKVNYAKTTGVFSGSFKLYYDYLTTSWQHKTVTVRFEGVLTPVPGSCCTEDPLPLGHGFFLVSDSNAEAGYTFKRSYPVWLGEVIPEE
jgi:hypothetical protein